MFEQHMYDAILGIHNAGHRFVAEYAGAGSQAIFWLHSVAGSSRSMLETTDRYSSASLSDLLGGAPQQFVSAETADAMADAAYRRAMLLTDGAPNCLGVGCTAAISTDRERRGANRAWIAVRSRASRATYGLEMTKGLRERAGEEELVSRALVRAIADACGVAAPALPLDASEHLDTATTAVADPLADLIDGTLPYLVVHPDGAMAPAEPLRAALLSGAFNPLHTGHEYLALASEKVTGLPAIFELPIVNADKPPLGYAEITRRLAQFRGRDTVVLSRAPLFVEKAALYPGCVFVLGYDTAVRLVDPRYYDGEAGRDAALAAIAAQSCRFLVAGRAVDGAFRTLRDVAIPPQFGALFEELPESAFRVDLSSTEVRVARSGG